MPLTKKGKKIMRSMKAHFGKKKGESVFYASRNKGTIEGVERRSGQPRTEEQRKKRHRRLFGNSNVPTRGTGHGR